MPPRDRRRAPLAQVLSTKSILSSQLLILCLPHPSSRCSWRLYRAASSVRRYLREKRRPLRPRPASTRAPRRELLSQRSVDGTARSSGDPRFWRDVHDASAFRRGPRYGRARRKPGGGVETVTHALRYGGGRRAHATSPAPPQPRNMPGVVRFILPSIRASRALARLPSITRSPPA
jgi:hypothetical protein